MRIGVLGGTFDPIHNGHLRLAIEAKEQLSLDIVLFVPAYIPPHKLNYNNKKKSKIRLQLIKKALASFANFNVIDYEIKKKGISYTIDTVMYLKQKFGKNQKYFFLLGSDWTGKLNTWKDIDLLKKGITFVMAKRDRDKEIEDSFLTIEFPIMEISSSLIREKLKKNQDIRGLVPDKIVPVVQKLYRLV